MAGREAGRDLTKSPSKNPMQDITVVQVNYNSAQVFEFCLRPLADAKKIILADNASIDDSVSRIEAAFLDASIIRNDRNLGCGTAMNQAAAATTPYVLQVNPDSVINAENVGLAVVFTYRP